MKYDYKEAVKNDIREVITNEYDLSEYADFGNACERIHDDLWNDDRVTGNASGSYFFNAWDAENALNHNWEEIEKAAEFFGIEPIISCSYERSPEFWDVTIRCMYIGECLYEVLEELYS